MDVPVTPTIFNNSEISEKFDNLFNEIISLKKMKIEKLIKLEELLLDLKKYVINKFNENSILIKNLGDKLERNEILLNEHNIAIKGLKEGIIEGKKELFNKLIDASNDNNHNKKKNKINEDNEINVNKKNNSISFKEIPENGKYSYECINKVYLISYIYKGTDEAKIEVILRNNGKKSWPKGITKLIPGAYSVLNEKEIILDPQAPGEIKNYYIICKGLKNHKPKEYKSSLRFSIKNHIFNEALKFRVIIKEKNISDEDIEENLDKILEFRKLYELSKEDYNDIALLNALKLNNFDYSASFEFLFN